MIAVAEAPRGGSGRVSGTRLRILALVALRPRTGCEIARELGINKSAAHKHLQRLVRGNVLTRAPTRKWVYYRLVLRADGPLAAPPALSAPAREGER